MAFADLTRLGIPTYHSRVERWECDTNNHWNTRFYARSFQMASEMVAIPVGDHSVGATCIAARHMRFHSELMVGAAVEIRSLVVREGQFDEHVVHLMSSRGKLSATALDRPAGPVHELPEIRAEDIAPALPRGIGIGTHDLAVEPATVEVGTVRPLDCDHTGALLFENIVRLVVMGSHKKMNQLGFTPDFITRTGISRMALEFRVDLCGQAGPGDLLQAHCHLSSASGKTFNMAHRLQTRSGRLIAKGEQCLIAVDLSARRATALPDFVREEIERRG